MNHHKQIWDRFCAKLKIIETSVPLFRHSDNLIVETKTIGVKSIRPILRRSIEMEQMICSQANILIDDWRNEKDEFDGVIYMMFLKESGCVSPLYIGKGQRNLSANIKNIDRDSSKFARWGDNYAYHIGDLSAVVLPGHNPNKINRKYSDWADFLFKEYPTKTPELKHKVYFWTMAWSRTNIGIWEDFGPTKLTFLECLMIGVASSVFPDVLLNREGRNR